jgi:hypothetical protein
LCLSYEQPQHCPSQPSLPDDTLYSCYLSDRTIKQSASAPAAATGAGAAAMAIIACCGRLFYHLCHHQHHDHLLLSTLGTLIAPAAFATGIFSSTIGVTLRLDPTTTTTTSSAAHAPEWHHLPLLLPHANTSEISHMSSFGQYPPSSPPLHPLNPPSSPPSTLSPPPSSPLVAATSTDSWLQIFLIDLPSTTAAAACPSASPPPSARARPRLRMQLSFVRVPPLNLTPFFGLD